MQFIEFMYHDSGGYLGWEVLGPPSIFVKVVATVLKVFASFPIFILLNASPVLWLC